LISVISAALNQTYPGWSTWNCGSCWTTHQTRYEHSPVLSTMQQSCYLHPCILPCSKSCITFCAREIFICRFLIYILIICLVSSSALYPHLPHDHCSLWFLVWWHSVGWIISPSQSAFATSLEHFVT
jgi:hypothetical protein